MRALHKLSVWGVSGWLMIACAKAIDLPAASAADLNSDGWSDASDACRIYEQWGGSGSGDLNQDGIVDRNDSNVLFAAWKGSDRPSASGSAADTGPPRDPPEPGTVTVRYQPETGTIIVSVNQVENWFVESLAHGLTGAHAVSLPMAGGLLTDNSQRIGETSLSPFTYSEIRLEGVAAKGLADDDLKVYWNSSRATTCRTQPVEIEHVAVPEMASMAVVIASLIGMTIAYRA